MEVINGNHQRQPSFARWGFRLPAFVLQARQVLLLETVNPLSDCRTRDLQEAADTDLAPPLALEGDHLRAGLGPRRVTVVIQLRERWRGGQGQALPEAFNRFMIQAIAGFIVDTHGLTPVALAKEACIYLEGCMPSNSL